MPLTGAKEENTETEKDRRAALSTFHQWLTSNLFQSKSAIWKYPASVLGA